ncbi:MAG: DUF349 domain-containing protein [Paludibacteraceae bacterium]|nr:DUF349 domain-containing protein [Paludibacteraceae bacterium]
METNRIYENLNRKELAAALKELLDNNADVSEIKTDVEVIKQLFYTQKEEPIKVIPVEEEAQEQTEEPTQETTEEQKAQEEPKEEPDAVQEPTTEQVFKELLAEYRKRKAELQAKIEAEQQENLRKKKEILEKLEKLAEPSDNLGDVINTFHELQNQWKEIGNIPAQDTNEIYTAYKKYQEQFYDLIKINAALRDYDFKRNLEQKQSIIAQAEELLSIEDVVKAFQSLQNLHIQWREIGPVAKELREEIWNKFKDITTEINKRHQEFFEKIKEAEKALTEEKDALCRIVEDIDLESLKTAKEWDEKTKQVVELNDKFQSNTPYEHRVNSKMYHRYREACDKFFEAKKKFFEQINAVYEENLAKKTKLVELAEQLRNSTEWQSTASKLQRIQKEWKEIGPVPRKYSNELWERFTKACDEFFAARKEANRERDAEEQANKEAKLAVIEKIKAFEPSGDDSKDQETLQALQDEFSNIGHIPFKDKDKVYNMFREAINPLLKNIRIIRRTAQLNLQKDKASLYKQLDTLRQQLATYENNMGFFHNYPKDNPIIKDLEKKIENLRQDIEILKQAIANKEKEEQE